VIGHEIANLVPTVTDKDGNRFLTTWTDKGKARYYSKEKGPAFLELSGRYANAKKLKADPVFKRFHKALNKLQGKTSYGNIGHC